MDEKIKNKLIEINESEGFAVKEEDLIETLLDYRSNPLYEELLFHRRHWDEYFVVVDLDGLKAGFITAKTTGDISPEEKGWAFDPNTISEVEKILVTKELYKPINK